MSVPLFFIGLLLGILAFVLLRKNEKKETQAFYIKPFIWLVFFSSIYEFVGYFRNWETPIWSRFYIFLDFIFIFYFFFNTLKKQYKNYFYFSLYSFLVVYIYLLIIWDVNESIKTDFYLTSFETVFVLISSILWFTNIFIELKESSLLNLPDYFFISGFVLYFTGTFFLFLVSDFFLKNMTSQFLSYWNLNIFFIILLRTLLIVGIWKARKK